MATNYATIADLEAYWRPLDESEESRATQMITIASSRLRLYASNSGIDIDAKIAESTDYAEAVKWVVMEATKRALSTRRVRKGDRRTLQEDGRGEHGGRQARSIYSNRHSTGR